MKIVLVSTYYSEGMGYTENCLPREFAKLGHEVHVITSDHNVYGNSQDYLKNYRKFLGNAIQPIGTFESDGYKVHRLPSRKLFGYIQIIGLAKKIKQLNPDIIHCVAIASIQTYLIALLNVFFKYPIFCENHQHMSVMKPYMLDSRSINFRRQIYWLTRTFPTFLASFFVKKCYATAPDCLEVANKFYGVPRRKLFIQSLGTDTRLFHPAINQHEKDKVRELRERLEFNESDIVCLYTGRFTEEKNPVLLARAINKLSHQNSHWKAVFVGEGIQSVEIKNTPNCKILPFMRHEQLADLYRAVDIAVWPRQESMSMLDAASSGLPLVVSDSIGECSRVQGNGITYPENDLIGLISALQSLSSPLKRQALGEVGRTKMVARFSWKAVAHRYISDYVEEFNK